MNIIELLEAPFQTSFDQKKTTKDLKNFKQSPIDKKKMGEKNWLDRTHKHGAYSIVRDDKTDSHMVNKTSREAETMGKDPFVEFVKYIYKNGYRDNVHMPRVYNVKEIFDDNSKAIHKIKIEKLTDGKDIDKEVMTNYIKSIADENWYRNFVDDDGNIHYTTVSHFVTAGIHDEIHGKSCSEYITSDSLVEACQIVSEAVRDLGGNVDTHHNNLMFRMGPYGIQVVFSDPIS